MMVPDITKFHREVLSERSETLAEAQVLTCAPDVVPPSL